MYFVYLAMKHAEDADVQHGQFKKNGPGNFIFQSSLTIEAWKMDHWGYKVIKIKRLKSVNKSISMLTRSALQILFSVYYLDKIR